MDWSLFRVPGDFQSSCISRNLEESSRAQSPAIIICVEFFNGCLSSESVSAEKGDRQILLPGHRK